MQLALTGIATLYVAYLIVRFLRYYVVQRIPFCCSKCKRRDRRVKEYTVVTRRPKPFRPSSKARSLINEKVQPSAPVLKEVDPVVAAPKPRRRSKGR